MAVKGSKKDLSQEHENYVARRYAGRRSPSSGAAWTDIGDVKNEDYHIECKGRFGERAGDKPVRSVLVEQFAKTADEAWQSGRIPMMALRFYLPGHILADNYGYVDLVLKLLEDDLATVTELQELQELGKEVGRQLFGGENGD